MTRRITGGCDFLGNNLGDALPERGEDGVIMDHFRRIGSKENLLRLRSCHGNDWCFVQPDFAILIRCLVS